VRPLVHPNGRMPGPADHGFLEQPAGRVGSKRSREVKDPMATRTYGMDTAAGRDVSAATMRGAGWLTFSAIVLGVVGAWNIIDGLLALDSSKVYGVNNTYVWSDLRTWGWLALCLGIVAVVAAVGILSGSQWARWFGIAAASINAIGQLFWVPVYPWWALMMFATDILIIYALTVYGGQRVEEV